MASDDDQVGAEFGRGSQHLLVRAPFAKFVRDEALPQQSSYLAQSFTRSFAETVARVLSPRKPTP